jgi:hypothetical protein
VTGKILFALIASKNTDRPSVYHQARLRAGGGERGGELMMPLISPVDL